MGGPIKFKFCVTIGAIEWSVQAEFDDAPASGRGLMTSSILGAALS